MHHCKTFRIQIQVAGDKPHIPFIQNYIFPILYNFSSKYRTNISNISKKSLNLGKRKAFTFIQKIHHSIVLKFNLFMLQICLNTLNNKTFIQFMHQIQLNRIPSISTIQTQTLSTPKTQ
ncbi:hypothetical protein ACB098_11G185500 [Castanea mollissima]